MKNLFQILPSEFFKPLTSKYKQEYADCILLLFRSFKPELSYGVNREIIIKTLTEYFEADDGEMTFDDSTYITDARGKANGMLAVLKACGWLEYEQETNHQLNVILREYTIPVIESMNKIIREEEAEYQGIISQIHASLQNRELYGRPYELVIKGVQENTERLVSELKKLNIGIKRHMDQQTNEMDAAEILEHFFEYHKNIGSKAYLRMKTSENVSYFRSSIIEKIEDILTSAEIMDRAVDGYMEIEQVEEREEAYDNLVNLLLDVKSSFYRLDDIIAEIDKKHAGYMRNAVARARFLLSGGNNMEGKISRILNGLAEELNREETVDLTETADVGLQQLFALFPQSYLAPESIKTMPVTRKAGIVDEISAESRMSEEERKLYKEALRQKNRSRFSRKNIDEYVMELMGDREQISVKEIPVKSKRDLIRIIYISIYAGNRSNHYRMERFKERIKLAGYELPYFELKKS